MNMQTTFANLGVGKNWASPFFPTLTSESINLVQVVIWMEKNLAGPLFSHPDKIKHQPCADGYLGGKNSAGPLFSHPDK